MKKEIRVFAPASVANVACGFDIFGFALETPGDELLVSFNSRGGVKITTITGDGGVLPLDPEKNTAGVSVLRLLRFLSSDQGVEIELHKKMPLGSGLGSSAASAAGAVYAVNHLLGSPLSAKELIPFAMEGERVACGTAHADNVAPSLLGGFTLIRSYSPLDVIQIPLKRNLYCTILHPKIEIRTQMARKILPDKISLKQCVAQTGNAAGLIAGLLQGEASIIAKCLEDGVVEPVRSKLIPGFQEIKAAAMKEGMLGCNISGSGPALFALSFDRDIAEKAAVAMRKAADSQQLASNTYISAINMQGPRIL